MTGFTIKSSWISLAPAKRLDSSFWKIIVKNLHDLGLNPISATDSDVTSAICKFLNDRYLLGAAARAMRNQAAEIIHQARLLEEENLVKV